MTGGFVVELSAVLKTAVCWTASVNSQGALERGWQKQGEERMMRMRMPSWGV